MNNDICLNCTVERSSEDFAWVNANVSEFLKSKSITGKFCSFKCLVDYENTFRDKPKFKKGK